MEFSNISCCRPHAAAPPRAELRPLLGPRGEEVLDFRTRRHASRYRPNQRINHITRAVLAYLRRCAPAPRRRRRQPTPGARAPRPPARPPPCPASSRIPNRGTIRTITNHGGGGVPNCSPGQRTALRARTVGEAPALAGEEETTRPCGVAQARSAMAHLPAAAKQAEAPRSNSRSNSPPPTPAAAAHRAAPPCPSPRTLRRAACPASCGQQEGGGGGVVAVGGKRGARTNWTQPATATRYEAAGRDDPARFPSLLAGLSDSAAAPYCTGQHSRHKVESCISRTRGLFHFRYCSGLGT
eukprot:SAG31_NODE_8235_length_1492_cov_1.404164_2_plen_296_part_01